MSNIGGPVSTVNIRAFLEGVFGADLPSAWLCAVPDADSPDWHGMSAGKCQLDGSGWDTQNCYYSVAVLKPGATSRKDVNWAQTRVIVIDDVVEKASAADITFRLGDPSFIVQTSPGSQQWGYILSAPITDANDQARLMRAITLAFFKGIEPGHRDLTRYVRLPVGVNNKTSRVAANGGVAPKVELVRWEPSLTYTWRELAGYLGQVDSALSPGTSAWDDAAGAKVLVSGSNPNGTGGAYEPARMADVDAWIARGDYVLAAFAELGWLVGEDNNGYFKVRCPWDMSGAFPHTNTDDRTGWSPDRFLGGERGFKCHHSDGVGDEGRQDPEVIEELRAALDAGKFDALERAALRASAVRAFAHPVDASQAGMLVLQTAVATATRTAAPVEWVSYGRNAPATPIAQRRSICTGFARGEVTYITAQPGAGKSAIGSVAFPLALAADRPELVGEEGFARTGDVYLVSNEDNADMVRKRARGWLDRVGVNVADLKYDTVVNKTQGFVAVRKEDRYAEVVLGEDLAALGARILAAEVNVCMVILDTQASVFSGINENDNSDAGACGRILTAWAKEHDVSLVIVHHMQKANGRAGGGGDQASLRGASGFAGMMRNGITLVGLSDEEVARLKDPKDRDVWVRWQGSKANHSAKSEDRWFKKVIVDVDVIDEKTGVAGTDHVPVYVIEKTGPAYGFNWQSDEAMYRVCEIVARMEREGEALKLRASKGERRACIVIADEILDADDKTADKALSEALSRGLIEVADNVTPKTYRVSAKGCKVIEDREDACPF